MQIESTRFGMLEVRDDTVLTFPDGLIGLPGTRYALRGAVREHTVLLASLVRARGCRGAGDHARGSSSPVTRCEIPDEEADAARHRRVEPGRDLLRRSRDVGAQGIHHQSRRAGDREQRARLGRQIINGATGYSVRQPLFAEVELNEVEAEAPSLSSVPAMATR